MKATEQYFPVVLFILLYKVILTLMKSLSVAIQMKATELYFPVLIFILLYRLVLTCQYLDEILRFDHANECSSGFLSNGTVFLSLIWNCRGWII